MLLWVANITPPFEPMSVGLSAHTRTVIVGVRDCPDNTNSSLFTYDLKNGGEPKRLPGVSQVALARSSGDLAGVGWNKAKHFTDIRGPGGLSFRYDGEPSEQVPTAISHDGSLSAYLLEPNPDIVHLNNRTGELRLVDGSGKTSFEFKVTGQGAFDPQSVAMSPFPLEKSGAYTVSAVLGSVNKVFEFDSVTSRAKEVWTGSGLQAATAVDGHGEHFAITSGFQATSVDIYARSSKQDGFERLATIDSPSSGLQAYALSFDRCSGSSRILAIAWCDPEGTTLALSAYWVNGGSVKESWTYTQKCGGKSGLNYVVQPALAVTGGGEIIVMGDWGCKTADAQTGKLLAFKGRGGDGKKPFLEATLRGQVWAVDCDADPEEKAVYISAGSWASKVGGTAAQISTWRLPL